MTSGRGELGEAMCLRGTMIRDTISVVIDNDNDGGGSGMAIFVEDVSESNKEKRNNVGDKHKSQFW